MAESTSKLVSPDGKKKKDQKRTESTPNEAENNEQKTQKSRIEIDLDMDKKQIGELPNGTKHSLVYRFLYEQDKKTTIQDVRLMKDEELNKTIEENIEILSTWFPKQEKEKSISEKKNILMMLKLTSMDLKRLTRQSLTNILKKYYKTSGQQYDENDMKALSEMSLRKNLIQKQLLIVSNLKKFHIREKDLNIPSLSELTENQIDTMEKKKILTVLTKFFGMHTDEGSNKIFSLQEKTDEQLRQMIRGLKKGESGKRKAGEIEEEKNHPKEYLNKASIHRRKIKHKLHYHTQSKIR